MSKERTPESEPVAWQARSKRGGKWFDCSSDYISKFYGGDEKFEVRPVYTHPAVEGEPVAIYQSRSPTHWAGWQDITKDDFENRNPHPPYPIGKQQKYEYRVLFTHPAVEGDGAREALEKIDRLVHFQSSGLALEVGKITEAALTSQAPAQMYRNPEECARHDIKACVACDEQVEAP